PRGPAAPKPPPRPGACAGRVRGAPPRPPQRLQRRRVAGQRRLPEPPPPGVVVGAVGHRRQTGPARVFLPLDFHPCIQSRQQGFANGRVPHPRGILRRRRRCNIELVGGARVIGEGRRIPPVRPGEIEQLPFLAFPHPHPHPV